MARVIERRFLGELIALEIASREVMAMDRRQILRELP
jgi:hypothetical protein